MATVAGRALIQVEYDPASISKLRATTAAEGNRMASSWSKSAAKLKSVGASLTRNLTLPLVLAGGAAIKIAGDFDSSLSKIQGLVGANTTQMEFYRKSILALAPAVAQGPTALADALYFVTSSGFKGAEALDILTVSAKASTAGLGETQQIADLVTSAMTAYGSKALSAAHATDILVAATKAGKGDPAEFAAALQLNVAAAENLGISFDQLAAATAALSTVNSNVSEDATQLSGIFTALIKPSTEGAKVLKKIGLSAAELRAEVADKGLLPALLDLKDRIHGNVKELQALFPNVRGLRGTFTLIGKAAQRNISIFDQVAHSTGNLNKAFKTALTNDPQVQFQRLTAQLQVMAIVIGNQLIPVALKLLGWVVDAANKFNGLSSTQQHFILISAGVVAALGPMLSIMGNIAKVIEPLVYGFRAFAAAETLAGAAATPFGAGLVILGATAVAIGIYFAVTAGHTDEMKAAMERAKTAADNLGKALEGLTGARLHVREAEQAHKEAAQALAQAERDQQKLIEQGKKGTKEYAVAVNATANAKNNLGETNIQLGQSEKDLYAATAQNKQALIDNAKALRGLGLAAKHSVAPLAQTRYGVKSVSQQVQDSHTAFQRWQAAVSKAGSTASAAAANLKNGLTPEMRRGKVEAAAMALGAIDLGKKIHDIPTTHQILVYYKRHLQDLIKEAQSLQRAIDSLHGKVVDIVTNYHVTGHTAQNPGGNAAGTNFWRGGSTWVGEQGPEIVNLPRGSQVIPNKQSMAMAGGGDTYVYIGNEAIDSHLVKVVRSENRSTARTVKAGRKW